MFFYRAWAGNEDRFPNSLGGADVFSTQFAYHRWGYAALLVITLLTCVIMNSLFLGSFAFNWLKQKQMPHLILFTLAIRDIIVALVLIPMVIDWYVTNVGAFAGGEILCKLYAFLDFSLAAEYSMILIILSIVLYTRKFPKFEETLDQLPMDEIMERHSQHQSPSVIYQQQQLQQQQQHQQQHQQQYQQQQQQRTPYRPPSRTPSRQSEQRNGSRAPSVVGSVDGYRRPTPQGPGFRPQRPTLLNQTPPKRPGSVTGSIEGRLAGSNPQQGRRFMASSPLQEATEEDLDLWEAASLDYPGRQSPDGAGGWDFMDQDEDRIFSYDEPKYHTWHYWLLGLTWLISIGVGVPAAMFVEFRPTSLADTASSPYARPGSPSRPGCFIPADPFKNPYSSTVTDPGFNFTLSFIIICNICTLIIVFIMLMLICYRTTDSGKFKRHLKVLTMIFVVFIISRSPIDILQLKGLIEAAMGFKQLNVLAYELEYEILLVWATYIPLFAHPIIYFCLCSEYREGGLKTLRTICGCQAAAEKKAEHKMDKYREEEIMHSRSTVSKTQVSNML